MEINKEAIALYQASIQKAHVQIKLFEEPAVIYNGFSNALEFKEYLIDLEEKALNAIDEESRISDIINYFSVNLYCQDFINDTIVDGSIYRHPFLHITDQYGNKISREMLKPNEVESISLFASQQYHSASRTNLILSHVNNTFSDEPEVHFNLHNIDIIEIHKLFDLVGIISSNDDNYTKSIGYLCKRFNHEPINNPRTQLGQMLKREVPFKLLEKMIKKVKYYLNEIDSED